MLRRFFVNLKKGTEHLNYGRDIIADWGADFSLKSRPAQASARAASVRVLDLGCGHGTDLLNVRERRLAALQSAGLAEDGVPTLELHGVEGYEEYVRECRAAGIETHAINIESDYFPGPDGEFDLLIANQILEHTKEVFWIFAEAARVLKPGGRFIVGVPNLASLHNRLLLFFGQQPTAQQTLSAHVRGFTRPDFKRFAETGGFFRLLKYRGSNFYPFPPFLSRPLSRLFPTMAWGLFFLLERTERLDGSFLECLGGDENFLETPFFGGPQNPAPARKTAGRGKKKQ